MLLVTSHFETMLRISYALNLSTSGVFANSRNSCFDFPHMIAYKEGVHQIITFMLLTASQNFFFLVHNDNLSSLLISIVNVLPTIIKEMRNKSKVTVYGQEKQMQRIELHRSFNHWRLIINTLSLHIVQTQI